MDHYDVQLGYLKTGPVMVILSSILATSLACTAIAGPVFDLTQGHFQFTPPSSNACDAVVYRNLSGGNVPKAEVPTNILSAVEAVCEAVISGIQIENVRAKPFLGFLLDEETAPSPSGSLGLGTLSVEEDVSDILNIGWVAALPLSDEIVNSEEIVNVYKMELYIRLANLLGLKVGVMASGQCVFGKDGFWDEEFTPAVLVDLED